MIITIIVLSILLVAVTSALILSFSLNKKLSAFAVRFEENYETAQNILDTMYKNLDDVLQRPVLIDDPVTVRVITQLKTCRHEILKVARLITMQNDEEKEENSDS